MNCYANYAPVLCMPANVCLELNVNFFCINQDINPLTKTLLVVKFNFRWFDNNYFATQIHMPFSLIQIISLPNFMEIERQK